MLAYEQFEEPTFDVFRHQPKGPCQFSPSVWHGNISVLSDRRFFASNSNVKVIISCMNVSKIGSCFLRNRYHKFSSPDYCAIVIDPEFTPPALMSQGCSYSGEAHSFVLKYGSVLRAIVSSDSKASAAIDISSPLISRKDSVSVIENIVSTMSLIQKNFPQTGMLIVSDNDVDHTRYSLMICVAYILNQNPSMSLLEAMVALRSHSRAIDDLHVNTSNFYDILNDYKHGLVMNRHFDSPTVSLKRSSLVSISPPRRSYKRNKDQTFRA